MSEWSQGLTRTQNVDSVPHFLQMGLLLNPITYRCLLRVLCPVRMPVTTLDCVVLKGSTRAFVARLGPEISSRAPYHISKCWLPTQRFVLFFIFCLETPWDSLDPINFWIELPLSSWSAISFPCTPACLETQYSPTVCQVGLCNAPNSLSHGMVIHSQFVSAAELAIRFVNFSHILEG